MGDQAHRALRGLRVSDEQVSGALFGDKQVLRPGKRVVDCRYRRKNLLDLCFNSVNVNIAHHGNGLQVRTVPVVVEIAQCFRLKVFDDRRIANDIPYCIL